MNHLGWIDAIFFWLLDHAIFVRKPLMKLVTLTTLVLLGCLFHHFLSEYVQELNSIKFVLEFTDLLAIYHDHVIIALPLLVHF
jgi:hypothetical protein